MRSSQDEVTSTVHRLAVDRSAVRSFIGLTSTFSTSGLDRSAFGGRDT